MWMEYPGGNLRFASYNKTDQISDYSKGYVLPLTYFGNVLNISAIEFLPVGAGSIAIELVRPICDGTVPCQRKLIFFFKMKLILNWSQKWHKNVLNIFGRSY